jgi:hypothetical protein
VLCEVDVEVDRAVEHGEQVGKVGDYLHPGGPPDHAPVYLKRKFKVRALKLLIPFERAQSAFFLLFVRSIWNRKRRFTESL